MTTFLFIIIILWFLFSVARVIIFGNTYRKNKNIDGNHPSLEKFKKARNEFVVSVVLLVMVGNMAIKKEKQHNPASSETTTVTANQKENKIKEKPKPVAYNYNEKDAIANGKGEFSVSIELKDGYIANLTDDEDNEGAELTETDDNHVILSGKIPKRYSHNEYVIEYTSTGDEQEHTIDIDNEKAYKVYNKKQIALEKKKKEEAKRKAQERKAAAAQKLRNDALQNENKLSYGMLLKTQDRYAGEPYHITKGHVMQAIEEDFETTLLVEVTSMGYGIWKDIIAVYYPGVTDAVDGDFIEVWGTLGKKWDYDTQIGGSNSVPSMKATSVIVTGHAQ